MRILSVVLGLVCAFFLYYAVRLIAVTGFLTHTRAGGQGAYVGAIAFPLLALAFGWASFRLWQRSVNAAR